VTITSWSLTAYDIIVSLLIQGTWSIYHEALAELGKIKIYVDFENAFDTMV